MIQHNHDKMTLRHLVLFKLDILRRMYFPQGPSQHGTSKIEMWAKLNSFKTSISIKHFFNVKKNIEKWGSVCRNY